MEVSLEYGYDRQIFGDSRQNTMISKSYNVSWAFYFITYTAIELSASHSEETITLNDESYFPDYDISVIQTLSVVQTNVFGIGIRQSLAGSKATIRPLISIGYAKQLEEYDRDITYRDEGSGATAAITDDTVKQSADSTFASFTIQIKLTRGLSINGSVKTVFPAFEFNKARDNVKYLVGFSLMF